ncbi:MAG TPA: hypothetical protein DIS98_12515 [Colwellia sp.]|nr:hypothetical protein [Colwellia sp.]
MFKFLTNILNRLKIAVIIPLLLTFHTMAEKSHISGKEVDNAYATKVWQYMVNKKLGVRDVSVVIPL